VRQADLAAIEDALEGIDEAEERDFGEWRHAVRLRPRRVAREAMRRSTAAEDVASRHAACSESFSRVLVLLVLEQPSDEGGARVAFLDVRVVVLVRRGLRQEHATFDVSQSRRHEQVLGREIELHELHDRQVFEVLLGDEADGNIEDVELMLLTKVEQKVEGSLEMRKLDGPLAAARIEGLIVGQDGPATLRKRRPRRYHGGVSGVSSEGESRAPDPYIGHEIVGPIEIRQLIGIGAMGRVYRGFQKGIDRDVAVKILHRELSANAAVVARFHREAKVASLLAHPNVVHVLLTGQLADGAMYIVMEYLDGMSLQSALAATGGTMALPRALHIALGLCEAAGEAHAQGIVHRDLKPENVMLVKRADDPDFVKVLDFGIARINWGDPSMSTAAGLIFGTARYISPEGARGEEVGPPGDVYSIATMFYQMLAGRTPFDAAHAVALLVHQIHDSPAPLKTVARASEVPEPIASALMRNLAKRPEDRAANAREFARELVEAAVASGLIAHEILARPGMGSGERIPIRTEIAEPSADPGVDQRRSSPSGVDATMSEHGQPRRTPVTPGTPVSAGNPRQPLLRGQVALTVLGCFLIGGAIMAGVAARTDLFGASHARAPQLEALISRANDALLHQRWDQPKGDNVRDITDDGLLRWPNTPQILRIRTLACADVSKAARARRDDGKLGEALHLATLANQLDPSDDLAQKLVSDLESQAMAVPLDGVPPLASAPTSAVRPTLDGSTRRPSAAAAHAVDAGAAEQRPTKPLPSSSSGEPEPAPSAKWL
jgi:serine/threonine protein kinase